MHHYARRQLGQQALNGLYEKASGWYKANGLLPEAVEMALAAEAFTTAAGLIEEIIDIYSIYHEITTMRRWLEQLPQGILYRYPLLCFGYAVAVLFKSDRSAPTTTTLIDGPLQQAEQQWRASQNWVRLGQLLAFRAMVAMWQGDRTANASLAAQALELLPESELMWRGSSLLSLSVEKLYAGRLEDAQAMAQEAYTLCDTARNYYAARAGMLILAKIKRHQGLLSETNLISQQILASSGEDLLDRGHALINLAELAYEQNRLAEAERWVSEALEIVHQYGEALGQYMIDESLLIPATVLLACLEYLRGKQESAQQRLNQLLLMTRQRGWLHRTREILAWQARLALRAGDLAAVERWAVNPERRDARIPLIQQETEEFVVARLLIVQCKAGEALLLLAPWQQNARDQKRGASELEILVLTALAHFSQDRQSQAKRYLKQALSLAKEQGYQRLFLDEGEPMAALLKLVLSELTEPGLIAFVSSLLSSFGSVQPVEQISAASALIERLSQQEERVLRLLAAGLSNPEIAGELIVSVNTVKTQVKSIYRKLDVHNRDEAGETARRLNLL
jgi:LuxR family maltose regulon positive regulatory protein